jgi:site-specific DNA recombinase
MRYLNYARRSSDEASKRQIQSIEDQLADTRRVQRDLSLNVLEELTESRSAKEPGRPVFNRMISLLQKGEADAVLCWKLDRLARNPIDAATLRWLMRQGKLKEIRTPYQVYGPDDNAVVAAVENAMAEQYIIDLRKGVVRGMKSKCEKGGFPLMAPSGYANNRLTREVEVDEERFALLQKAWRLLLAGNVSVPQIHDLLVNQWGYRGRVGRGNPNGVLTLSGLYNIFHNPFYMGRFSFMGTTYVHRFPRMVTKAEWERAQEIMDGRGGKKRSRNRRGRTGTKGGAEDHDSTESQKPRCHNFPYTGLMVCATCGFMVTAEKSKGHVYYHCNNKTGQCTKKGIRQEEVERHIDTLLREITLPLEFEALANRVLDALKAEEESATQQIRESRKHALSDVKKQKDALLSLYLRGLLDENEYAAKKNELNEQETSLNLGEGEEPQMVEAGYETVKHVAHYVTHARDQLKRSDLSADDRRALARHLAESYILNNGDLQITLHPMFEPVRSEFKILWNGKESIEPLEIRSGKRKKTLSESSFPLWCSTLERYRRTLLASNNK